MRVYVDPPQNLSRAMFRVSEALKKYVPATIEIVKDSTKADLQVLHVVGTEGLDKAIENTRSYAMIQYCLKTAGGDSNYWRKLWVKAKVVWSYYDLGSPLQYYAPLGVDYEIFRPPGGSHLPRTSVFTSGYVSGPSAEAIEEVANAAKISGLSVFHLGPENVEGMPRRKERTWSARSGLSDEHLARVYGTCRWVSGLRQVEGFELPVLEGFACGARPVVFDRSDMRQWYSDFAVLVPECHGPELTEILTELFNKPTFALDANQFLTQFNWQTLCEGFWKELLR